MRYIEEKDIEEKESASRVGIWRFLPLTGRSSCEDPAFLQLAAMHALLRLLLCPCAVYISPDPSLITPVYSAAGVSLASLLD
jgi:hypothetical protein